VTDRTPRDGFVTLRARSRLEYSEVAGVARICRLHAPVRLRECSVDSNAAVGRPGGDGVPPCGRAPAGRLPGGRRGGGAAAAGQPSPEGSAAVSLSAAQTGGLGQTGRSETPLEAVDPPPAVVNPLYPRFPQFGRLCLHQDPPPYRLRPLSERASPTPRGSGSRYPPGGAEPYDRRA
jgi:hypothetical protein